MLRRTVGDWGNAASAETSLRTGYLNYWTREFRPYLRAAAHQFKTSHRSLTERLLQKASRRKN